MEEYPKLSYSSLHYTGTDTVKHYNTLDNDHYVQYKSQQGIEALQCHWRLCGRTLNRTERSVHNIICKGRNRRFWYMAGTDRREQMQGQ